MRTSLVVISMLCCVHMQAQVKKTAPTAKPAAKPAAPAGVVLKTRADSVSYAIGVLDGTFFKSQGLTNVNSAVLGQAFKEALAGNTKLTPEQCNDILRVELDKLKMSKVQPTVEEGQKFLAANKKRPGVVETASGIQYEVITQGTGPKPVDTSVVRVHYVGTFLNGQKFDSSRDRGQPITFSFSEVIRGWGEVIKLQPVGTRFKCWIPYSQAYGLQDYNGIPGGSTLVFDIELLELVSKDNGNQ